MGAVGVDHLFKVLVIESYAVFRSLFAQVFVCEFMNLAVKPVIIIIGGSRTPDGI